MFDRRIQDGRLLLLEQVLERFVVREVVQSMPYSIGHVEIVPDYNGDEEEQKRKGKDAMDENFARVQRAKKVQQMIQYYHKYEFADTKLPLPKKDIVPVAETTLGSEINKIREQWQTFLEIASTRERLACVLKAFQALQDQQEEQEEWQ